MFDEIDLSNIQDENARELVVRLLNLVEAVSTDLRNLQAENQRLRDEVNRLKGEQGKLKIKPNTPKPPRENYSSEKERRKSKPRQKQANKDKLEIHREQTLSVDPASWQRMLNSRAMKMLSCRTSSSKPTTSAFTKRSTGRLRWARRSWLQCLVATKGSLGRDSKR